jgi:hypothetical protein
MPKRQVKVIGYVEIPDGMKLGLGHTVEIERAFGEITSDNDKLTREDSGKSTITTTYGVTLDPDETVLGAIRPPSGPLDDAMAAAAAGRDDRE